MISNSIPGYCHNNDGNDDDSDDESDDSDDESDGNVIVNSIMLVLAAVYYQMFDSASLKGC